MTSADTWAGRGQAVLATLYPAGTRRATLNALASLLAGASGLALIGGLVVIWAAAVLSLASGPTGGWELVVLYAVAAVAIPVPMLWAVQGLTAMQRSRLVATLGVDVPPADPHAARRPWPVGPWREAGTWRQLGFHLMAVVIGGAGGGLVLACLAAPAAAVAYIARWHPGAAAAAAASAAAGAMLIAAPRLGRLVTRADEASARKLLGPSRSDDLARQVESLARSRADIVAATDAERRRIERDLHDGAQQRLVSLAMNLGIARAGLTDLPEPARQAIAEAHDEAVLALSELREFIRGLHPAVLNDRGLDAALSGIAARAPLPVRLRIHPAARSSPSIEAVAYFTVSEALANVAKHANATRAEVTVTRAGGLLRIVVTDDGRGGAAIGADTAGAVPAGGGTGLLGLAQRAASVDGTLTIDSPPGGPTVITAELPCES
jgi:signal transduction histidine kinase